MYLGFGEWESIRYWWAFLFMHCLYSSHSWLSHNRHMLHRYLIQYNCVISRWQIINRLSKTLVNHVWYIILLYYIKVNVIHWQLHLL
jgi:hypothetical protein